MLIKDFYTITEFERTGNELNAVIFLNKDHDIFKGHFPGNPVMPGVCMIQIIKELTEKAVKKELFLSVSTNIKFMAIINPEVNPTLKLNIILEENDGEVKIKNTLFFDETLALKMNATFKILA